VAENLVKEGVGSMYKILFLVTAYNVMTGTIEQILADSLEEARQMPYVPARWIDRITRKLFGSVKISIDVIAESGIYSVDKTEALIKPLFDRHNENMRFLIKGISSSRDGRIFSTTMCEEEIKYAMLVANNERLKSAVINEISYWGVYTINKNGERDARLKVGTANSRYQKPEYTLAPSLKVDDKFELYHSLMDESEMHFDNYICCLCDREINDDDYHWLVLADRYCKACVSNTQIRAAIPMDGIICKGIIGYIGVERLDVFGFSIW